MSVFYNTILTVVRTINILKPFYKVRLAKNIRMFGARRARRRIRYVITFNGQNDRKQLLNCDHDHSPDCRWSEGLLCCVQWYGYQS